ncbi:hypothetical protein PtB15_15B468 [Puccinia triticina]|nr:hypothetical protein PtB15_15B468 [Puccinia triticina]
MMVVTTGSKTPDEVLNKAFLINPEVEGLATASKTKSYASPPLPQMSTPQVPLQAPASVFLINKYGNKLNPKHRWFKILPTPPANPA